MVIKKLATAIAHVSQEQIIKEHFYGSSLYGRALWKQAVTSLCGELACSQLLQRVCVIGPRELPVGVGPTGAARDWTSWAATHSRPGMWFEGLASSRGLEAFPKMWLSEREVHWKLEDIRKRSAHNVLVLNGSV